MADADKEITYEQAKETVLEALHVLGDDYVALLKDCLLYTSGAMALVIEYADTEQEARQNALEDGDRFYLDETTLDEMLRLMIAEIERC